MPSSPLIYIIAGIVFLGALAGLYGKVHHDGYEEGVQEITAKWQAANAAQRQKEAQQAAKAATTVEAQDVQAKVVYKTITQSVDRYIDRPVYRNVCFDDDGLRDANSALLGKITTPGKPPSPVSPAKSALRWDWSLSIAKGD